MKRSKKRKQINSLTVVSQWPLQFAQLVPYIYELENAGTSIHFCVTSSIRDVFPNVLSLGASVTDLDSLSRKKKFSYLVHTILKKLFEYIFSILPESIASSPNRYLNEILTFFGKLLFDNPFPTKRVVSITKNHHSHLFCSRNIEMHTILGSWDHPAKIKASGYKSDVVYVWNEYLAGDWRDFQGYGEVNICYPMPFDYVLSYTKNLTKYRNVKSIKTVMYTFTSQSDNPNGIFQEECLLAASLACACEMLGYNLILKPKPNSRIGELDFLSNFRNVEIASYLQHDIKEKIVLNDEYNNKRLEELSAVDIVIVVGTTFAIDSAIYGLPVLQFKIDLPHEFPAIFLHQKSPHLKRHLLGNIEYVFEIKERKDLKTRFYELLSDSNETLLKAQNFSKYLRDWIGMPEDREAVVRKVACRLLK